MHDQYRIIKTDEFNEHWKPIHNRVFVDRYPPEKPFRRSQWEMFLFEGMYDNNETLFHAISPIAKQLGDQRLIIFVWEGFDESESYEFIPPVEVPWSYPALQLVDNEVVKGSFDAHIFGPSGQWGMYSSSQEFVMYVGGEPAFMNALAAALGGRDGIRKDFLEYATTWEMTEGEVAESAINTMRAIVESVGWDWPGEKLLKPKD